MSKRAKARATKIGKKAAQLYAAKMAQGDAVQVVPAPACQYAQERGDLYSPDPAVRERSWQDSTASCWLSLGRLSVA